MYHEQARLETYSMYCTYTVQCVMRLWLTERKHCHCAHAHDWDSYPIVGVCLWLNATLRNKPENYREFLAAAIRNGWALHHFVHRWLCFKGLELGLFPRWIAQRSWQRIWVSLPATTCSLDLASIADCNVLLFGVEGRCLDSRTGNDSMRHSPSVQCYRHGPALRSSPLPAVSSLQAQL